MTYAIFGAIFLLQSLTALITSIFDYCNSLIDNISSKDILKFQYVQNCIAIVVTWSPRFSHSVSLLKSLHWLPVQSRFVSKPCTITYQTLSSGEPSCLYSMLYLASKHRELRSSDYHLLSVSRVTTHAGTPFLFIRGPTL